MDIIWLRLERKNKVCSCSSHWSDSNMIKLSGLLYYEVFYSAWVSVAPIINVYIMNSVSRHAIYLY